MGFDVWPAPQNSGVVGPTGAQGPAGSTGPAGAPGVVQSVNGKSTASVTLNAADVGALPNNADATLNANQLRINASAGTHRFLGFQTNGANRWILLTDNTNESGANSGSNFQLAALRDNGDWLSSVIHGTRATGQVTLGGETPHGSAQTTVTGAVGLRDVTADPAVTSGGVFLYSKAGVPYFRNADGTSFQVKPSIPPVSSVNGQTGAVNLGAVDVGALATATGGRITGPVQISGPGASRRELTFATDTIKRWSIQADDGLEGPEPEAGGAVSAMSVPTTPDNGSDLRIVSYSDTGSWKDTVFYVRRDTGQSVLGSGPSVGWSVASTSGPHGLLNINWEPEADDRGVQIYAQNGVPYVMQGDGTIFQLGPGGGAGGGVQSVNGRTGVVTVDAADVGALPVGGGTVNGVTVLNLPAGSTDMPLKVTATDKTTSLFEVRNTGSVRMQTGNVYVDKNLRIGGATAGSAGATGALILQHGTPPTAGLPEGALVYAEGGKVKVRQSDGAIVTVADAPVRSVNGKTGAVSIDLPARNTWTAQALGFQAWSVDPATVVNVKATSSTGEIKAAAVGRTYFAGINITEPTPVSKVAVFARGWGGSALLPNARFFAGIYDEAGNRVAWTGDAALANVPAAGLEPGTPDDAKNAHIGAVPLALTQGVTLQPGRYWAAFLLSAGGATDFYYVHIANWAPSNQANFHLLPTAFMRAGYLAGQTTLPTTITPSAMKLDHDPIILALA